MVKLEKFHVQHFTVTERVAQAVQMGRASLTAHSNVIGRDRSPAERRVSSTNNARPVSCCPISFQGQGCGKLRSGV